MLESMKGLGRGLWVGTFLLGTGTGAAEFTNTILQARHYIAGTMESQHLAAVSVALVHSQEVVWLEAFGWEDLKAAKPATTATVFRVGSVTKALTGAAAVKLSEEGRIELDAAYTNYLPEVLLRPRFPHFTLPPSAICSATIRASPEIF